MLDQEVLGEQHSAQSEVASLKECQEAVCRVATAWTLEPVDMGSNSGSPLTSRLTEPSELGFCLCEMDVIIKPVLLSLHED